MTIFEQLENAYDKLRDLDLIITDFEIQKKEIKSEIEQLEQSALVKLLEDKEQGGAGEIVGQVVYSCMRLNPKPIISDESKIPDRFFKTERKLMKSEINKAIKDGETIEGVTFDNGGYALTRKSYAKG